MQILTFPVPPVYYLPYCDFFVRFCAVFAQSKNLFRNSENTAQNLTGESQYRIVYTGEKENENLHNQKEVFSYLEQRERCGYLGINKIGSRRSYHTNVNTTKQTTYFIFSISYDYIKVRCMLYDCVYTVSAFTYLLVYN